VDANVPQLPIDAFYMDDDGKEIRNPFRRMYRTGKMWARSRDGKITLAIGDIFVDKKQWSEVIKDYAVQERIALKKVKNDRFRHIVICKDETCSWRIHASRLSDEVIWQVKSLKGTHHCARL